MGSNFRAIISKTYFRRTSRLLLQWDTFPPSSLVTWLEDSIFLLLVKYMITHLIQPIKVWAVKYCEWRCTWWILENLVDVNSECLTLQCAKENNRILITSDSQEALRAPSSQEVSSRLVWQCLEEPPTERNKVELNWVPGTGKLREMKKFTSSLVEGQTYNLSAYNQLWG